MDRRNQPPAAFWGESLNFWCRLWQAQIEHSMRFWGAVAAQMPRPTSRQLAAEAESIKAARKPATRNTAPAQAAKTAPAAEKAPSPAPAPAKAAGRVVKEPAPAPLH
jgi:hypothetical protein